MWFIFYTMIKDKRVLLLLQNVNKTARSFFCRHHLGYLNLNVAKLDTFYKLTTRYGSNCRISQSKALLAKHKKD